MRPYLAGAARAVVAVGACAGVVAGASMVPTTSLAANSAAVAAGTSAAVTSSSLICPGPELRGVDGIEDRPVDVVAAAVSPPESLVAALDPRAGDGQAALTTLGDAAAGDPVSAAGTLSTTADPSGPLKAVAIGPLAPGLAAAQQWLVDSGDDRSFGSAPCTAASADAWLLAGGGAAGRQERLVLTNPSANPVTVDVTLHGADGPIDSPNGSGIVVPAQSRSSLLVDGISATESAPAVHVVANGGVVQAVLNDRWLDGTVAAGSDDASRSADPSREQVIPGLALSGRGVVRVVVPGPDEAVVQVRALTAEGPRALSTGGVVRVAGGGTADISLDGLPSAIVGLQVRADVDVVAGAMADYRRGSDPGDFAWSSSTTPIDTLAGTPLLPVESGLTARRSLALVSTGGASTVDVVTTDGKGAATTTSVDIPVDATVKVRLADAASVWVAPKSGDGAVRAGVVTSVDAGEGGVLVTNLPLTQPVLTTTSIGLVDLG